MKRPEPIASTFSIRSAVRAVIDDTDLASPEEIAAKVAESIPAKELRAVVAVVLRDYVRIQLHQGRLSTSFVSPSDVKPSDVKPNGSAKVRAIRDAAPRWLRDRVYIGAAGWTLLGECTYENLLYLESERLDNAAASTAAAQRYARLAALVKRYKVARVADLPKRVLAESDWQAAA